MDPNAALEKALAAAHSVLTIYDAVTAPAALEDPDFVDHAAALAEAMTDLDEWFRGGSSPTAGGRPNAPPSASTESSPSAGSDPPHQDAEPGRPPPGKQRKVPAMSAFMVSDTHIDALITAGLILVRPHGPMRWLWPEITVREVAGTTQAGTAFTHHSIQLVEGRSHELYQENATDVGAMLVAANRDSVNFWYAEEEIEPAYRFRPLPGTPDPLVVLKVIGCYEYQSCEHPEWRASQARQFCDALKEICISSLAG